MRIGGSDDIRDIAISAPHWKTSPLISPARPAGIVFCESFVTRSSAKKNSFHEFVKAKSAITASAGSASGIMMRTSDCNRVAPSTSAASSSSLGMVLKYEIASQVQKGTVKIK